MAPRIRSLILYIFSGLVVLIIAGACFIFFASDTLLKHVAGSQGSAKLGRNFSIDGPIKIDWAWKTPYVHLSNVHLANMPDSKDPNMVAIDSIDFHIRIWKLLEGQLNFPDISLTKPVIILEKRDEKTKNWDFPALSKANVATHAVMPTKRGNFPIIDAISIKKGTLTYRDATKNLDLTLDIDTASGGGGEKGDFKLNGQGSLQDKKFSLDAVGGSLSMLRNSNKAYPLSLNLKMGDTNVAVNGTFTDPINMEGIDTTLDLRGDSLADLYYLTVIPLPPTPHYQLSGHLLKKGDLWTFENFKGKVGNSDLSGNLTYDVSGERGFMKAALVSELLDMKDLAGFTGATPAPRAGEKAPEKQKAKAAAEKASPRLLPDIQLNLSHLRATDLDVTLRAEKILAPGLPMQNMDVRFNLKDGVLKLDPLSFGMESGKVSGTLTLDGSKDVPHVESNILLTKLGLQQFFKGTRFEQSAAGHFGGRFELAGDGRSVAEVAGDSNGHVTVMMAGGSISQLLIDAAGLDVGKAAPILLSKDKGTFIRCGIGDFGVKNGSLNSNIFVFDTTISNLAGDAHINLKDETIDAKVQANPKKPTVALHTAILVNGSLKHPSIGIDPKEAAARGAAAAALSAVLTPLAAIIPFIETGLGKDSDCGDLIQQARSHSGVTPPPAVNP